MTEFTFDLRLDASISLKAVDLDTAKRELWALLQCASTNFGAWPNGEPALGEVSLNSVADITLGLVDGEEPEGVEMDVPEYLYQMASHRDDLTFINCATKAQYDYAVKIGLPVRRFVLVKE